MNIIKVMVFPAVMDGCEISTIKKAERQKTDAFDLCWKVLESPLDSKETKLINPKGKQPWVFILKLNLQYLGHMMWKANSLEKTPLLGKTEGRRRRGRQRMRWLDGITDIRTWAWANSGTWWRTGKLGMLQLMGSGRVGHNLELNNNSINVYFSIC